MHLSFEHNIITLKLFEKLDEYRAFRHFFVHGYGIMLDEKQLIPLAEKLNIIWKQVESELTTFLNSMEKSD